MTLKNITKMGLATAAVVGSTVIGSNDINAQTIGDSTKVTKTIGLEFLIYDENTNLPIEGAGADVAGKYSGYNTYYSFVGEGFYNFEGLPSMDENGIFKGSADVPVFSQVTDVKQDNAKVPTKFGLVAYPNPYNPSTNISFDVLERGNVNVGIYNVLGQEIVKWSGELTKGNYSVKASGGSAGVEFVVVQTKNNKEVFKLANLGGNSTPFIEVPNSSNDDLSKYVNNESNNSTGSSIKKIVDEPNWVIDTLRVEWGASGYLGNVFYGIPINGATNGKVDSIVTLHQEGIGFVFNKIIPGENGVDTVKQYFNKGGSPSNPQPNNKFWGQAILYGNGDGSAVDSIKFKLPLGHD